MTHYLLKRRTALSALLLLMLSLLQFTAVSNMPKELSEYTITAKLLNTYEIKVMATDSASALASLDEWVAEDFTQFITNQQWDMEAI